MKFRTDISFLRAISVLMVMFYHFQIPPFSGGFIGVDVFFVISGFLMTQITLKGFQHDKFSLKEYYIKRSKRIIPAMHFMLYFVLLISVLFFFRADLRLNAKYVFLSDFFVSNIYFWKYQNYFASGDNILLHTWSLGVEWQFYLLYPVLLMLLRPTYVKRPKLFWSILCTITLSSLMLMIFHHATDNNFSFYMLPARFWELSIGGLAFGVGITFKKELKHINTLTYIAALLILACSVLITDRFIWPSYYTIIPVTATALMLSLNVQTKLFDNKPVKVIGDISYSLYLWHWPWWILFKYFGFVDPVHVLLLIILSVFSAIVSYRLVEKKEIFTSGRVIVASTIIIASLSTLIFIRPDTFRTLSLYQNKKFEIANYGSDYKEQHADAQFNPCGCYVTNNETLAQYNNDQCLAISNDSPNILLLGDSHMAQFSSALRRHTQYNWLEASMGYVLPIPNPNGNKQRWKIQQDILKNFVFNNKAQSDLVIISVHWLMRHNPTINMSEDETLAAVAELVEKLDKNDVNYLFVGQTQTYTLPYPKIAMLKQFGRDESKFVDVEASTMNAQLKQIVPKERYIDLYETDLIDKQKVTDDEVYMFDGNHYSSFGAEQAVDKVILPRIKKVISQ